MMTQGLKLFTSRRKMRPIRQLSVSSILIFLPEANEIYSIVAVHGIGAHPDDPGAKTSGRTRAANHDTSTG